MNEPLRCTLCENRCLLHDLACLKGQRFYEVNPQPYCTLCDNHCFLSNLQCRRGRSFYGAVDADAAPVSHEQSGNLIMRFEMCWHQFRRVRGGLDGQMRILRFLHNHGAATQRDIQEALGVKSAAMSEHISKLEAKGFIQRTSSGKDKRAKVIRFTPEGEKMFNDLLAAETNKNLFASLTFEEQETLTALLKKLSADWRNRESAEES